METLDRFQLPALLGHVPQPAEKIRRLPRRKRDHLSHSATPFFAVSIAEKRKNVQQLQVAFAIFCKTPPQLEIAAVFSAYFLPSFFTSSPSGSTYMV